MQRVGSALLLAWALVVSPNAHAQNPAFDVASVKPSAPPDRNRIPQPFSWGDKTGKVNLIHIQLQALLTRAYGVKPYQLSGPSWITTEFYDIVATAPAGTPADQMMVMLQSLLADRFKLQVHRETESTTVMALVVAKGGPKLEEIAADRDPSKPAEKGQLMQKQADGSTKFSSRLRGPFGEIQLTTDRGFNHFEFMKVSSQQLAEFLGQGMVGMPVVDRTGLTGFYHLTLDVSLTDMRATTPALADTNPSQTNAQDPVGGSIFESLQKAGLRLERSKAPIDKVVIDHIEKIPTEN
jgi:uncharacterized protein (TIGR03435 family)